jgi:hypothetical protein
MSALARSMRAVITLASLAALVGAGGCVSTHLYDEGPLYATSPVPRDVGAVVAYWPPSASAKITGWRVWCNHRAIMLYAGGYGTMWLPPGPVQCAALDVVGGHETPVEAKLDPGGTIYVRLDVSVMAPSIELVNQQRASQPDELTACHLVPGGRARKIVED